MSDYVIRATAAEGQIRAFAAVTRELVETARKKHDTSPVVTAALGRLLTSAAILGTQLKGEEDKLTLKIKGDGPAGAIYAVANSHGEVKGFAENPQVLLHARPDGKLDVGGAIGKGELTIIRDLGLKEPYVGTCELVSGEIAQDLTYYFAVSEQTPSSVSLGVLMNKNNTVAQAGGFMLQLMPGTTDEIAAKLEERILAAPSVTVWLNEGLTPEEILNRLLEDMGLEILEKTEVRFHCGCSREKMEDVLIGLGRHELLDLMVLQETVEVHCDFCNSYYRFSRSELKEIFKRHYRSGDKTTT
ncbi:MAG: Hsp33 family molecular chaperone HslO [Lachnospiraceae bacterium]|nr:Hsp33 family molecular chaperone HslO [Lachnospiraceae bacterium]